MAIAEGNHPEEDVFDEGSEYEQHHNLCDLCSGEGFQDRSDVRAVAGRF